MRLVYNKKDFEIRLNGLERVWALKKSITVPYASVLTVSITEPPAIRAFGGIRVLGTYVPGLIAAGHYRANKQNVFVYSPGSKVLLDITLREHEFDRIAVAVRNAEIEAATINEYINERSPIIR